MVGMRNKGRKGRRTKHLMVTQVNGSTSGTYALSSEHEIIVDTGRMPSGSDDGHENYNVAG